MGSAEAELAALAAGMGKEELASLAAGLGEEDQAKLAALLGDAHLKEKFMFAQVQPRPDRGLTGERDWLTDLRVNVMP